MNLRKRIATIILALIVLSVSLPSTAFAVVALPTGTLTIHKAGSTFTAYKIYNMTLPAGSGAYEYDSTGTVFDAYLTAQGITPEQVSAYTTAVQQDEFIAKLQTQINSSVTGISASADASGNAVLDLPLGYYLVVETATDNSQASVASKAFLASVPVLVTSGGSSTWNYNVTATPKDSNAAITKVIEKGGNDVKSATQNIGDDVNYKLQSNIPTYDASATGIQYYITDTMSKGLTFDPASVVITAQPTAGAAATLALTTDYTVTTTTDASGNTVIKIDFVYANIKSYANIVVKYQAKLNKDAVIGSTGNPNDVKLSYTSNPSTNTIYEDKNHKTIVYTTGIAINKTDDTPNHNDLSGAVFELRDNANNVLAVYTYDTDGISKVLSSSGISTATDATGMTYFIGLNEGTYTITETIAPVGYSLLPQPVILTINASKTGSEYNGNFTYSYTLKNSGVTSPLYDTQNAAERKDVAGDIYVQVTVEDHAGFTLPGTGGIGTVIFAVGGAAIMVLGAILLIVYKAKSKSAAELQ